MTKSVSVYVTYIVDGWMLTSSLRCSLFIDRTITELITYVILSIMVGLITSMIFYVIIIIDSQTDWSKLLCGSLTVHKPYKIRV